MNRLLGIILLFAGAVFGAVLSYAGFAALKSGDRAGWLYLLAALLAFLLAWAPGRRLRSATHRQRTDSL